jgi:hypothetical protein
MKIEEDKDFLIAQRQKGRPGKMGNMDKNFVKKEANSAEKKSTFGKNERA